MCGFSGCPNLVRCKGYCSAHYRQLWAGKPLRPLRASYETALDRFQRCYTVSPSGCWVWIGTVYSTGYGQMNYDKVKWLAHRWAYTYFKGGIAEGYHIDHMCHNKLCVNPEHLRLATDKENGENRSGANKNSKSGVRGVSWAKARNKWLARVVSSRKTYHVGYFDTLEEAEQSVIAKRLELYTHNIVDRLDTETASV